MTRDRSSDNPLGIPLGWAAGTAINSIDELRAEVRFAVEAGFDALWVSQIFGVDPVVALAAVAADVEPLAEVGTSVVPIYGRHPLALAAMARTAQSALQGRFTLGIGPSHAMVVEGFFGESNDGDDVRLIGSSLLSTNVDAPIQILASEHSGRIRLVNSTVDTQGPLTVLAFDCEARLEGEKLDCSTAALEAELTP